MGELKTFEGGREIERVAVYRSRGERERERKRERSFIDTQKVTEGRLVQRPVG